MATVTLRPSSTSSSTSMTTTGAASIHAALADDSDASYVTPLSNTTSSMVLGLDDLTLPAGAVIKSASLRIRIARTSAGVSVASLVVNTGLLSAAPQINWTVPTTFTAGFLTSPTDAALDAATFQFGPNTAISSLRIYEVYVDVVYVAQPTGTVDSPTGTVGDTNQPAVIWMPL